MDPSETAKTLKKVYFRQLIPAIILLALAFLFKYHFKLTNTTVVPGQTTSIIVTTLAGIMGIALPVFYRSYFVYKIRNRKQILPDTFITFERVLSGTALLAPYFLIISVIMNMPETADILITLFAIYGGYYYYPSEKRVIFEMKIFRMKLSGKQDKPVWKKKA